MNAAICAHDETHPWSVFKSALCTMLPTEGAEAHLRLFDMDLKKAATPGASASHCNELAPRMLAKTHEEDTLSL